MNPALRRYLLVLFSLALVVIPFATLAETPDQPPRVGYLLLSDAKSSARIRQAFADGLRSLGYVDGRNITLDFRYAAGNVSQFEKDAEDLVHLGAKVIVTASTVAFVAAQKAAPTSPIVFATIPDPVGAGFVESMSRPGRNFTGLTILSEDLNAKRLELITQIIPGAKRIAMLENPDNPSTARMSSGVMRGANALGLTILPFDVREPNGFEAAFSQMPPQRVDAVLVLDDAAFSSNRAILVAAASPRKLPLICPYEQMAEAGCLCSYGINFLENFERSGVYVDKILKGASPSDLPVENPRQFETVINLDVAEKLGLAIPDLVRLRADRLIR